ncbi:unnamed protein product, partial [Symbiodinium sp. KB8]
MKDIKNPAQNLQVVREPPGPPPIVIAMDAAEDDDSESSEHNVDEAAEDIEDHATALLPHEMEPEFRHVSLAMSNAVCEVLRRNGNSRAEFHVLSIPPAAWKTTEGFVLQALPLTDRTWRHPNLLRCADGPTFAPPCIHEERSEMTDAELADDEEMAALRAEIDAEPAASPQRYFEDFEEADGYHGTTPSERSSTETPTALAIQICDRSMPTMAPAARMTNEEVEAAIADLELRTLIDELETDEMEAEASTGHTTPGLTAGLTVEPAPGGEASSSSGGTLVPVTSATASTMTSGRPVDTPLRPNRKLGAYLHGAENLTGPSREVSRILRIQKGRSTVNTATQPNQSLDILLGIKFGNVLYKERSTEQIGIPKARHGIGENFCIATSLVQAITIMAALHAGQQNLAPELTGDCDLSPGMQAASWTQGIKKCWHGLLLKPKQAYHVVHSAGGDKSGRVVHLRLRFSTPLDILCLYQVSWNVAKSTLEGHKVTALLKQRARIWHHVEQWLRAVPGRHGCLIIGDLNTPLTPEPGICGPVPMVQNIAQQDQAELQAILRTYVCCALNSWTGTGAKARTFLPPTGDQTLQGTRIDFVIARGTDRYKLRSAFRHDPNLAPILLLDGSRHRNLSILMGQSSPDADLDDLLLQGWEMTRSADPGELPSLASMWKAWIQVARLQACTRQLRKDCRRHKTLKIYEAVQAENVYAAAKQFAPRQVRRKLQLRTKDGQLMSHEQEFQCIKDYFTRLYHGPNPQPVTLSQAVQFEPAEVQVAILKLSAGKAMPQHSAPAALWRTSVSQVASRLCSQINSCLGSGCCWLPERWSTSDMALIPKPGKAMTSPEQLRPISLEERHVQVSLEKTVAIIDLQGPGAKKCLDRYLVRRPRYEGLFLKFMIAGEARYVKVKPSHTYLGVSISYKKPEQETAKLRLDLATGTFRRLKKILTCRDVPLKLRLQLWQGTVLPTMLHGVDSMGLPLKEANQIMIVYFKQVRSVAKSFSMFTHETNQDLAKRLGLADPLQRLLQALDRRSCASKDLPKQLLP